MNPNYPPQYEQQNNPHYPPAGYPDLYPPYAPVMTVKNWLGTLLLLMIPIANIVLLFVWAFGSQANPNKQNYAKAYLLIMAIVFGLYITIFAAILIVGYNLA